MLIRYLFLMLLLCASTVSFARSPIAERQIKAILKAQETAWNKGDPHGFMKGYWNNDSMLFVGKKGPTYGYEATLANYIKSYPDTAHMGHFTSVIVQMQSLGSGYYMVIGRWQLQRSIGDIGGYYSLLFRRIKRQWVIIQDHTS